MHTKYFGTVIYASDTRVSFTRFNFRRNVQMSHLLTLTVTLFPGEKILTATACNNNACQLQRVGCGSTFKRFVLRYIGLFIYRASTKSMHIQVRSIPVYEEKYPLRNSV